VLYGADLHEIGVPIAASKEQAAAEVGAVLHLAVKRTFPGPLEMRVARPSGPR